MISRSILIPGTSEDRLSALSGHGWPFGLKIVHVWPQHHWRDLLEPLYQGHVFIGVMERDDLSGEPL